MKIGIPKEIKNNENRVGMTPAGVAEFIRHGHEVMVQHTAGENSGFADEAMQWAVGNGIISGKYNGTILDPQGDATRAECATIIMRFIEKISY